LDQGLQRLQLCTTACLLTSSDMDLAQTARELDRLQVQLEACEALHARAEQSRNTLQNDVGLMQERVAQALEASQRDAKRRRTDLPAAPSVMLPNDLFTSALREQTVPVHVGESTLHVHRAVLRSIPRFAAQLDGPWLDSDCIHVELPCNTVEFCLILRRMYTGQLLGSPSLVVEDCSSALRLCASANMLLIDDLLPELESVVLASIVTSDDAAVALGAAQTLPCRIARLLEGLTDTPSPTSANINKMILQACTSPARQATSHILSAHNGRLDRAVIASAAKQVVTDWRNDGQLVWRITWSTDLARLHLDCVGATSIFAHIGSKFCGECPFTSQIRSLFCAHLLRCAKSHALAVALPLGKQTNCTCSCCDMNRQSILRLGKEEAASIADATAAAPQERRQVAALLREFSAGQLVEIITDETAKTLGDSFEQIVSRFISEPYWAVRWFTNERLLRLPLVQRRAVSTALLTGAAGDLSEDVARTVAITLG